MSALDDVLGHLPEADRANYARIAARYGLPENSPEIVSASLILEAVGARIDKTLANMDARIAQFETVSDSLPDAMREAGAEIVRNIAADTRTEIVAGVRVDILAELTRAVNVAGDLLVEHHRELAGHLSGLSDTSTEALAAVVIATTSSTSEIRDAAVAARTQVKHLKDFQIWKLGTQIAAVIALVLATAWIASNYTYDTQHTKWFNAGWTTARHR